MKKLLCQEFLLLSHTLGSSGLSFCVAKGVSTRKAVKPKKYGKGILSWRKLVGAKRGPLCTVFCSTVLDEIKLTSNTILCSTPAEMYCMIPCCHGTCVPCSHSAPKDSLFCIHRDAMVVGITAQPSVQRRWCHIDGDDRLGNLFLYMFGKEIL